MSQFIVEISSKRYSKTVKRYAFDKKKSITIGRSYGCDIILDDIYVSEEQIKVTPQKSFQIEDLNSENGTYVDKSKIKNDSIDVESGAEILIGHTIVKVFSGDHAIKPTQRINWSNDLREVLLKPISSFLLICVACFVSVFYEWTFSRELDFFEESVHTGAIDALILIGLLSFIFYVLSLLSKDRLKITAAISYACLFSIVISVFAFIPKMAFAASLSLVGTEFMTSFVISLAISGAVLFVSYVENSKIGLKDWLGVLAIIGIMQALAFYDHQFPDEYDVLEPRYESSMSALGWSPDEALSIDEFVEDVDIFQEIEEE